MSTDLSEMVQTEPIHQKVCGALFLDFADFPKTFKFFFSSTSNLS